MVLKEDDHFEKFIPENFYHEVDFVSSLKSNQVFLCNLPQNFKLVQILEGLNQGYKNAKTIESNFGQVIGYKIQFETSDQVYFFRKWIKKNKILGKRLNVLEKENWSKETQQNRTIVIDKLKPNENPEVTSFFISATS